ncbi:MAG: hypothetical protein MZW92_77790 [Comamonadaceae bacterium]|nr:hypothetical protein [Comamonadaceae bacterium]
MGEALIRRLVQPAPRDRAWAAALALFLIANLYYHGAQPYAVDAVAAPWDKAAHMLLFFILGALVWVAFAGRRFWAVFIVCAAGGGHRRTGATAQPRARGRPGRLAGRRGGRAAGRTAPRAGAASPARAGARCAPACAHAAGTPRARLTRSTRRARRATVVHPLHVDENRRPFTATRGGILPWCRSPAGFRFLTHSLRAPAHEIRRHARPAALRGRRRAGGGRRHRAGADAARAASCGRPARAMRACCCWARSTSARPA